MERATLNVQKLSLPLSTPSDVYLGSGAVQIAADYAKGKKTFLITDSNVRRLYGGLLAEKFPTAHVFCFRAGEKRKNHKTLFSILSAMKAYGLGRKDLVVCVGGGVVGDIGGLAAALYMRGVALVQIPTTLLSQVDSSVGGKTAVDFCGVKNLIGAFYQPGTVCIDPMFLHTLPEREIVCGLGEILKTAALDEKLYDFVYENRENLMDGGVLSRAAVLAVQVKARVVCADEKETTGQRKTLNVGHTLGHAVEMCLKNKSHGQCVMWGMLLEMAVCGDEGTDKEYLAALRLLLGRAAGNVPPFDVSRAVEIATHDKKNENGMVSMIVPTEKGKTREVSVTKDVLTQRLTEYCKEIRRQ